MRLTSGHKTAAEGCQAVFPTLWERQTLRADTSFSTRGCWHKGCHWLSEPLWSSGLEQNSIIITEVITPHTVSLFNKEGLLKP